MDTNEVARLQCEMVRLRRCLQLTLQEAEALVERLRLQLSVDWSKEGSDDSSGSN